MALEEFQSQGSAGKQRLKNNIIKSLKEDEEKKVEEKKVVNVQRCVVI